LKINADKCVFFATSVEFLGHQVDRHGVRPLQSHVAAVEQVPRPGTCKDLQRFCGLVNFYRRFIPGAAGLLRPLTDALASSPCCLEWSADRQASFKAAKAAVANAALLVHTDPAAEVSLATDASSSHVGAVLQQKSGAGWAFLSKKLNPVQRKYSPFDRELLAVTLAFRHFHFFLEGRDFIIFTDHKPLTTALNRVSPPVSARQQRGLSYIAEFLCRLIHTPGEANVVADALSRPGEQCSAVVEGPPLRPVDFGEMALMQAACPDVAALRGNSRLKISYVLVEDKKLFGDTSTGGAALSHASWQTCH
jgi:RNase H-like domain found in reverse transcriptase